MYTCKMSENANLKLIHDLVLVALNEELNVACFNIYQSRMDSNEFERDMAYDLSKNLISHCLNCEIVDKFSDFIHNDDSIVSIDAENHQTLPIQVELFYVTIKIWQYLVTITTELQKKTALLLTDIIGHICQSRDEDCEAALFTNSDEDIVNRFEQSTLYEQLWRRWMLIIQLEAILSNDILCHLVDNIKMTTRLKQADYSNVFNRYRKWGNMRAKYWYIISADLKKKFRKIDSEFMMRYGNDTIKVPGDALNFTPSKRAYFTSAKLKQKRIDDQTYPVFQPAKKYKPDVEIENLEVEEQVAHRKREITTNRLLSFFGGEQVNKLELQQCYREIYSNKYGNVIILENGGRGSLIPITSSENNTLSIVPILTPLNNNLTATTSITTCFSPEWSNKILTTLWPLVDKVNIYTDSEHHYIMPQCFSDYVREQLNDQYYARQFDYNDSDNYTTDGCVSNRGKLTFELHALVTRLFREVQLFNPRTLSGPTVSDYEDFHTRFILHEVLLSKLHIPDSNCDKQMIWVVQQLEDILNLTGQLTLNTGLLLGVALRQYTTSSQLECKSISLLSQFWLESIDTLFRITECLHTPQLVIPLDQVHYLRLFLALNVISPTPSKHNFCINLVASGDEQNNATNFRCHLEQQYVNIESLAFLAHTTAIIVLKNSKKSDLYLCCLAAHSVVINYWWRVCINKFRVRNSTRNSFTSIIVSIFPSVFFESTIQVIRHCFLFEPEGCYVTCVRLSCALIEYIKHWAIECNEAAAICVTTAWSKCAVYKTIYDRLILCRKDCQLCVNSLVDGVLPELMHLLVQNAAESGSQGYLVIDQACKNIELVRTMDWCL